VILEDFRRWALDAVRRGRAKLRGERKFRAFPTDPKYALIRNAVLARDNVSAWYQGHLRLISPFVLGTKGGDPHVLGYQFGGTSHRELAPEGSEENWRCLRVSELTEVKVLPGMGTLRTSDAVSSAASTRSMSLPVGRPQPRIGLVAPPR
jgi:hypothetical protein